MSLRVFTQSLVSKAKLLTVYRPAIMSCSFSEAQGINTAVPQKKAKEWVSVTFEKSDGQKVKVSGKEGDSLLDVVVNNSVDLEGYGACEGTLSCSTCHLIFKQDDYKRLPEAPSDEELDMLDLAYGLSDTSRLGCQVCLSKDLDGVQVKVPEGTSDARKI